MEIRKINTDKQKLLITYAIVSDKFLEEIYPILKEHKKLIYSNFDNYYRTVLNWCLDYFEKYHKAPNQHIQEIYNDNKQTLPIEDQELLSEFLSYLSSKYEKENINEKYVLDLSLKYLREINLNILQKEISELKKENKIDEAEHKILTYEKLDRETEIKQETFLFKDEKYAYNLCDNISNVKEENKLFKYKGDLGTRLDWICREDFMSILGAEKIGKSFMLRETAILCSIDYELNVLVFNLEMSHDTYNRNFYQNMSQEIKYKPEDYVNVKLPYFDKNPNGKYDIKYNDLRKFGLNSRKIKSVFNKQKIKTKGEICVRSFPSGTLTFQKMSKILDDYALNGFVVDVVLIDYLDNLKSFNKNEYRHGIDEKWLSARRLAQEKHIAVITVSHTNKKTFKKNIDAGDETETRTKGAHITHSIGLNQTSEEKEKQLMRINIVHNRDSDFSRKEFFLCLECRSIGKVLLDNLNIAKVNYNQKKEK